MKTLTSNDLRSGEVIIHIELNKKGSRFILQGDSVDCALVLALACKMKSEYAELFEQTKIMLAHDSAALDTMASIITTGKL